MRNKSFLRMTALCLTVFLTLSPVTASAATLQIGSRGTQVKNVQTALMDLGYFNYQKATGYYGTITKDAIIQFQKDCGLDPDGIYGKLTKDALAEQSDQPSVKSMSLAKSADTGFSGTLDWFNSVQYLLPRKSNALITDVETGLTFEVKRTYGTNHADVEPLTKADAAVIKKLWNGWSWDHRAVVVQFGDYTLAASMAGMPHAGVDSATADRMVSNRSADYGYGTNLDAVKNNGVSGVFDLHFKNSRSHNTNQVSSAHQAMVKKAAKYIEDMGL